MRFQSVVQACPKAALMALVLSCGACASLQEQYLAVAPGETENTYYRVTVKGDSYFSSSKFQAGVVDSNTVNRFFGEDAKPIQALSAPAEAKKGEAEATPSSENTVPLDPLTGMPQPDRKLVMVLSNDATVIFAQLQTFSESQAVSGMVAALAQAQQIDESALARAELDGVKRQAGYWKESLSIFSSSLDAATDGAAGTALPIMFQLQGYLGGSQP